MKRQQRTSASVTTQMSKLYMLQRKHKMHSRRQTTNFLHLSHVTCEFYQLKHLHSFYRLFHIRTVLKLHRLKLQGVSCNFIHDEVRLHTWWPEVSNRLIVSLKEIDESVKEVVDWQVTEESQSIRRKFCPIITLLIIRLTRNVLKSNSIPRDRKPTTNRLRNGLNYEVLI